MTTESKHSTILPINSFSHEQPKGNNGVGVGLIVYVIEVQILNISSVINYMHMYACIRISKLIPEVVYTLTSIRLHGLICIKGLRVLKVMLHIG